MTKPTPIDSDDIAKLRARLCAKLDKLDIALRAASALLWFVKITPGHEAQALSVRATPKDSSATGMDATHLYLDIAAQNFAPEILNEAIRLAQIELETAEQ